MTPDFVRFQRAIETRIDSDMIPMMEELNLTIQNLELDGYEKAKLMRQLINIIERTKDLCWEGASEVVEQIEISVIRRMHE